MIYQFKNIKGVHLELTTKCNANCPMCGRNFFGVVRPNLCLTELNLRDCKTIFSPKFIKQLQNINICGVYGEPTLARDLIEIILYLRHNNSNIEIDIYTNGGTQIASWWKKLAQIIGNGKVIFGIDGLRDTNHIYRQGVNFSSVIRNAKAFIRTGGRAQWDFIVFKHNEHQVEQARGLSKRIGFKTFQIKRTSRFYKLLYEQDPALKYPKETFGRCPVYTSDGQQVGYVELPTNAYYGNDSLAIMKKLIKKFGSLIRYFDSVFIDCQAKKTKGIFVSAEGLIYPCCWIYQQTNYGNLYGAKDPLELNEKNILNTIGKDKISAKKHHIENIIKGDFFKKIEKSWSICGIKNGRSKVCARHCGCRLDMHKKQHEKLIK